METIDDSWVGAALEAAKEFNIVPTHDEFALALKSASEASLQQAKQKVPDLSLGISHGYPSCGVRFAFTGDESVFFQRRDQGCVKIPLKDTVEEFALGHVNDIQPHFMAYEEIDKLVAAMMDNGRTAATAIIFRYGKDGALGRSAIGEVRIRFFENKDYGM